MTTETENIIAALEAALIAANAAADSAEKEFGARSEAALRADSRATQAFSCLSIAREAMATEGNAWQADAMRLRAALKAIEKVLGGTQPKDIPGALMVARYALKGEENP